MIIDDNIFLLKKGSKSLVKCQCDICGSVKMVRRYSLVKNNDRYPSCNPCSARRSGKGNVGRKRSDEHRRKTGLASKGRKPSALHIKIARDRMLNSNPKKLADRKEALQRELSRRRLNSVLHGVLRRAKISKGVKTHVLLGYGPRELRSHLEALFQPNMGWHNCSEWHVDHIKPVSAFLAEGVTSPAIISALSNLRPLWKLENLRKGMKRAI